MPKRSSKLLKKKTSTELYNGEFTRDNNRNSLNGIVNNDVVEDEIDQQLNRSSLKEKRERKKSVWAPAATATSFTDVPVYTICPYCNQKVVTKTQFRRGRKNWYCFYWLPYFLHIFKDVIHTCPKCNTQIAIYNRFFFFKRDADDPEADDENI